MKFRLSKSLLIKTKHFHYYTDPSGEFRIVFYCRDDPTIFYLSDETNVYDKLAWDLINKFLKACRSVRSMTEDEFNSVVAEFILEENK